MEGEVSNRDSADGAVSRENNGYMQAVEGGGVIAEGSLRAPRGVARKASGEDLMSGPRVRVTWR